MYIVFFIQQKNVPFSDFFQVEPLQSYHRVVLAEDFMKHLAPTYWPKGKRHGYCWLPPNSKGKCVMKVRTGTICTLQVKFSQLKIKRKKEIPPRRNIVN